MKNKITLLAAILTLLFALSSVAQADADLEKIKKNMPKLLGANNQGMEFVLSFFPSWLVAEYHEDSKDQGIFVFISSSLAANVTISVPGKNWVKNVTITPNVISEIKIPREIAIPSAKKEPVDMPEPAQVFARCGIIVTSDAPIVCYGLLRYLYTSDGFLGIPIHSLGKEYTVASYNSSSIEGYENPMYFTSYTAVVGAYDNTKVEFTYGGDKRDWVPILNGWSINYREKTTVTLNKGDVWLLPVRGYYSDITGSHIKSDLPVACFSGHFCANIPTGEEACDYIIEQDMPTYTWSKTYFVTPIKGRARNSFVRLFANKSETSIYRTSWDEQVAYIANRYGAEGEGWVEIRAAEGEPRGIAFIAKNPINVVQYSSGSGEDNVDCDPFQLNVLPAEQFQDDIIFCTPGNGDGLKFDNNYVNLVYKVDEFGRIPDDLEIGFINSGGQIIWRKINDLFGADPGFKFVYPANASTTGDYYCKQIDLGGDGSYRIRANDKFTAYAYGFSSYDSYAFPTSAATMNLSMPDTVKPIFDYTKDCQGYVPDRNLGGSRPAYVKDMPDEDSLRSNLSLVFFDKANSYNYEFHCYDFIAGEDRYAEWSLTPINPDLDAKAVITFFDRAGNDTTVVIEHGAVKLQISPYVQDFGVFKVGESKKIDFKIINRSKGVRAKLQDLKLLKGATGFKLNYSFYLDEEIAPGESKDFSVTFTAVEEGEFSDSILVAEICSNSFSSYIHAKVESAKILVSDATFPKTSVGKKSDPLIATIRNTGSGTLKVTGYKGPLQSVFTTDLETMGIAPDRPLEIESNREVQFNIWFTPDADIYYTDSIVFESGAGSAVDPICLISGEGMRPALTVSNVNWLRKRVHLPKYDAAPYSFSPYPAPIQGIKLVNEGSQTTTIKSVSVDVEKSIHPEAFKLLINGEFVNIIDRLDVFAGEIGIGDVVHHMAYFDPRVEGEHRLALIFESDAPTVTSVLEGAGIYPRIKTADIEYGDVIFGADPSRKMTRFTNDNWGPYADSLVIRGFKAIPEGSISKTDVLSPPGTEGFAYSDQMIDNFGRAVSPPITLQPGEYVDIFGAFMPLRVGGHTAKLESLSDAEIDQISAWNGIGVDEKITAAADPEPAICHNDTAIIVARFENAGNRSFYIARDKLYIRDDVSNSFSISKVVVAGLPVLDWRNGFSFLSGQTADVYVKYDPIAQTGVAPHTANVILNTDAIDSTFQSVSVAVSGRAFLYRRTTRGTLDGKELVHASPDGTEGLKYSIYVDAGQEFSSVDVKEYRIRVVHKRNFLDVRKDGGSFHIFKGDGLPADWDLAEPPRITLNETTNEQSIDVVLRGATSITNSNAFEILKIDFFAFLPWFKDTETGIPVKSKDSSTVIRHYLDDDEPCVDYITPGYPIVELEPVCANDIRSIELSSNRYNLSRIVPNPIDARGGEIQFENAFDNEEVQLNIFNSNNELVATLVNGSMKAGKHSIRIPIESLSSGAYSYQLIAGPYKATETLIIVK